MKWSLIFSNILAFDERVILYYTHIAAKLVCVILLTGPSLFSQENIVKPIISDYSFLRGDLQFSLKDSINIYYQGGFDSDTIDLYINGTYFSSHLVEYDILVGNPSLITTISNKYVEGFYLKVFFRNADLLVEQVYIDRTDNITIMANGPTSLLVLDSNSNTENKFIEERWPASCTYYIY